MYKIDKRSTKKQIYLYRMRNYNVVTKNGTEKTNKKGENSKEDMYEKENGVTDNGSAGGSRTFTSAMAEEKDPITIWCWDTSENGLKMNQAFTDATGIEVNMVAVESKDMTQKLQTTLASGGEMPDIAWLESTYRGKLLSLDIWERRLKKNLTTLIPARYWITLIPLETTEDGQYVGPECPSFGRHGLQTGAGQRNT